MSRSRATLALAALLLVGVTSLTLGGVFGAFTGTTSNAGDSFATAPDFRAPTAGRSVIGKTAGGVPGFIKQGGNYFVYADVIDTGNPASGISSVTSNTSNVNTGATSSTLSSGSFSIGGLPYSHRSASLTANAVLVAGTYNYSATSTDAAGNSGTQTFTVTVDNTVPTGTDIQAVNGGATAGRPDQNDTVTFTYSEPIDPESILAGWTGSATNVVVRINNNTPVNDQLQVFNAANAAQLPLGNVNLGRTDYTTANRTFGATGTASSMSMSGNSITVMLGNPSGAGTTAAATGTMVWTPSATATDRAGNAASTANVNETGAADKEF
ncbi:MAG: hypothetical protein ACJ75Z_07110 [Solirubrobacterales bacterium]